MPEAAAPARPGVALGRSSIFVRSGARERAGDDPGIRTLDLLLAAMLAAACLTPGLVQLLGVTGEIELLFDLLALAAAAFAGWLLATRAVTLAVPLVGAGYVAMIVIGVGSAEPIAQLVSARNMLLLPAVAILVAALPGLERRARWVALTLLGVATIGFFVTIGQAIDQNASGQIDTDSIVGTLGAYANWATAMLLLMASCVALGRFLTTGRRGWPYLLLAGVLPVFTAWAVVMIVAVLLPLAGLAVIAGSLLLRARPPWPRIAAAIVTVGAATGAIFLSYYTWHPDSFKVLTNGELGGTYLQDATIYEPPARRPRSGSRSSRGGGEKGAPQTPVEVPGRATQLKNAYDIVDDGPTEVILGKGLGVATFAANVGVERHEADPKIASNSFTDLTTLLIERGLLGLLVVGGCLLGLIATTVASLRRRAADTRWSTAILVGYPGVLGVMCAAAAYASPFRNSGTSAAFFLLTAVVLAIGLGRGAAGPPPRARGI